ncbi:Nn.00g076100.m01.CDS01 [Neocucurbitaria sp. VM-36]
MSTPPYSICEEINRYLTRKKEEPNTPWANPSGSLIKSSKCGCRYCYTACDALGNNEDLEKNRKKNLVASFQNSELNFRVIESSGENNKVMDALAAEFRGSGLYFSKQNASSEVFVENRNDDPIIPVSSSISGYTGSNAGFRTAIRWLEECVKTHHTLCPTFGSPTGPPKLPHRVLDVNLSGTQNVRLLQTTNEKGYYASLSHCWGGQQPLTTTLDTLENRQQGIKWERLPKTFQEAVVVTRVFGIQYLWIDSLCIIQDDDKDWQVQSAQMANIYQNSIITFAGSASSGPQQGLFRNADPDHIDHGLSGLSMPEGLGKVRKRKPLPHNASDLPLMQRGWVFQERLLSPRYLHFGQHELMWECMERLTCECGGLGFQERSRFQWLKPKNRLHPFSLQLLHSRSRGVAGAWQAAVVDYTTTTLSYPSDIFPAFSGIAKIVREATGWEYVAGMWKENLITDLVWRVENPQHARRCEKWRAPTFSWASVMPKMEGGSWISYDFMDFLEKGLPECDPRGWRTDVYAAVEETSSVPLGDDTTGRLVSGYIVLSGTLIQATLRSGSPQAQWKITTIEGDSLSASIFRNDYDLHQGEKQTKDGDVVYCLKLIGLSKVPVHESGEYLLHLVLRKVAQNSTGVRGAEDVGVFERIGLLRDARGPDAMRLEELSPERAVLRHTLVKIL